MSSIAQDWRLVATFAFTGAVLEVIPVDHAKRASGGGPPSPGPG